jgi:hypothetical protein
MAVAVDEFEALGSGLGDQQVIEGIAMVIRHGGDGEGVGSLGRQWAAVMVLLAGVRNPIAQHSGCPQTPTRQRLARLASNPFIFPCCSFESAEGRPMLASDRFPRRKGPYRVIGPRIAVNRLGRNRRALEVQITTQVLSHLAFGPVQPA